MGTVKQSETKPDFIAKGRTRYLAHTDNVMVVVVDFNDGPAPEPDPPHSHPHEQVSYVASGEIILILGTEKTHLSRETCLRFRQMYPTPCRHSASTCVSSMLLTRSGMIF